MANNLAETSSSTHALPALLLKANAGTGKTFQLSNRFLKLLFLGQPPDKILATTFTRKAAAEIRERIFLRLVNALASEQAAQKLGKELELGNLSHSQVQRALRELVSMQHRLSICTLDSLYTKLLGMYALELGFSKGIKIATDEQVGLIREKVVAQLLSDTDSQNLREFIRVIGLGVESRSVVKKLLGEISAAYSIFQDTKSSAWNGLGEYPKVEKERFREALDKLKELKPVLNKSNKQPNKVHANALSAALNLLTLGSWERFLEGGIAKALLAGELTFSRAPIPDDYIEVYQILIQYSSAQLINMRIEATQAIYKLMQEYHKLYLQERERSCLLTFGDTKRVLSTAKIKDALDELYFRLDTKFNHILLDEFQDTSVVEWQLLEPLAGEILSKYQSSEASFLCVGDIKQAIYGWRGGEAEIFQAVTQFWPQVTEGTLNKSYRSSQQITDFVNRIFLNLEESPVLVEDFLAVANNWEENFVEHVTTRQDLPGYLKIFEVGAISQDKIAVNERVLIDYCIDEVSNILKVNPNCTIGILLPQNKDIREIVRAFSDSDTGIVASEEGGNPLTDSKTVLLFLALLNYIDHPGCLISRYHILNSPVGAWLELTINSDNLSFADKASTLRAKIQSVGLGIFLREVIDATALHWSKEEHERLSKLIELAYQFEGRRDIRLSEFIDFIKVRKIEQGFSSNVRVMTYHKSKGLEFDAVFLPFLHRDWFGRKSIGKFTMSYTDKLSPPSGIFVGNKGLIREIYPAAQKAWQEQREKIVAERLNVLYVAVTRPKNALYIPILSENGEKDRLSGATIIKDLLRDELVGEGSLYERGDSCWMERALTEEVEVGELVNQSKIPLQVKFGKESKSVGYPQFKAPSSLREEEGGSDVIDNTSFRRGILLHNIAENIEWLDDGKKVEVVAENVANSLYLEGKERESLLREATELFLSPTIMSLFKAKQNNSEKQEVYRELPFALEYKGAYYNGCVDRVVINYLEGVIQSAEVIDFKSDNIPHSELKEKVSEYTQQILVYAEAVSQIFKLPKDKVRAKLAFLRLDEVVEV